VPQGGAPVSFDNSLLFPHDGRSSAEPLSGAVGAQYDVAPDGKRMVVSTYASSTQQGSGHVIFLENFIDELQRKMPVRLK